MKKNIAYIIIVILVIFITSGVTYLVVDNNNENKDIKENNKEEINKKNVIEKKGKDYEITLNEKEINISETIIFDNIEEQVEYVNVNIFGFKLNNFISNLKIENLSNGNAACVFDNKKTSIILNDKTIDTIEYEGCYITHIIKIFIIAEKYIGILYQGESLSNSLSIYNINGKEIYSRQIIDIDTKSYNFTSYDENDEKFLINDYELIISNDTITDNLIKKGTKSYCDRVNDYGYCE